MGIKDSRIDNFYNISDEEYIQKKEVITSFFLDKAYTPMTMKQIGVVLGVSKNQRDILQEILSSLEDEAFLYIDDSKRYIVNKNKSIVKCIYQAKSERFGFGLVNDGEDIYISSKFSMGAMDKDEILVRILENSNRKREGEVIKITKRAVSILIGRVSKSKNFAFVVPIDNKYSDVYLSKKNSANIKDGQIVKIQITKYATSTSKAEGKILTTIGDSKDENIEVKALYSSYDIDRMSIFPKDVEKELDNILDEVLDSEKISRRDKTKDNVYTIDGDDAKDLDDGVCVKRTDDGNYILSVYIADVSHYVKHSTSLDMEALRRGTSIYIPGKVIPMLPKKLSNGICSLNEGVERLSLAVDMIIDNEGNILESDIYKAVINVKKRMTYDKVYKVITGEDDEVLKEYLPYKDDIFLMQELACKLMEKRHRDGSINFDIPDTKIELDEDGIVSCIKPYEITIANKIIEEFMLAANMTVAEKFYFLDIPFMYRIHEKPDEEKLRILNELLTNYGKRIKGLKNIHPKALSDVIDSIEDEDEKRVVSTAMLRTLKLAKYSDECLGHFGLAAKYYCHFTSPIRRYPDLFIHRVISEYINTGANIDEKDINIFAVEASRNSILNSESERQATQIERDFDDLYIALYMKKFEGHTFKGVISSTTSFGMFVKLDNTAEGLVAIENISDDDYYIYDEKRNIIVGENTSKVFKIGDKVNVILEHVDVRSKKLDFALLKG